MTKSILSGNVEIFFFDFSFSQNFESSYNINKLKEEYLTISFKTNESFNFMHQATIVKVSRHLDLDQPSLRDIGALRIPRTR